MNLPDNPLAISKRQLSILELQTQLENQSTGQELAYTSPIWARLSLPHKNPGAIPFWEVRDGHYSMTIQPGVAPDAAGRMETKGIPYGVIPRQFLTFLVTEAVQKKDPTIQLGGSLAEFLTKLGITSDGGNNRKRVKDQIEMLTWCRMSLTQRLDNPDDPKAPAGYRQELMSIATGAEFWLNGGKGEQNQPALWGSTIDLAPEFFKYIVDRPVPVYLEDLRVLGDSSMRLDIYTWLVHRLYYLEHRTPIKWDQLHQQFGRGYARERAFRANFELALKDVLKVYTKANVSVTPSALVLMRSANHVRPALRGK
jgi:hypothetical protein